MQMKKDAICKARRQAAARYVAVTVDCLAPEDIVETVRVGPRGAVRTLKQRDATDEEVLSAYRSVGLGTA